MFRTYVAVLESLHRAHLNTSRAVVVFFVCICGLACDSTLTRAAGGGDASVAMADAAPAVFDAEPHTDAVGGAEAACRWPNGDAAAAVSLTYDDRLISHLDIAAPLLEANGFRGTFFINTLFSDQDRWRELVRSGHELAAHTPTHPCPAAVVPRHPTSEEFDLPAMNAALLEDIAQLESLGAQPPYSFAYPCGITWVGNETQSYVDLVRQHFIGARGVVGLLNNATTNLYETYARSARPDPALTIAWLEEALAEGKWAVVLFHSVDGDYEGAHSAIVRYLADHRDRIWTAPFRDIVRCVRAAGG